jgi:hypothetical protein
MTGPLAALRSPSRTGSNDQRSGRGGNPVVRIISVAALIIIAVVVGVYLLTNSSGNPNTPGATLGNTPQATTSASTAPTTKATAKAKATTSATKGGTTATSGYVLSTPATAGGYPQGQDPNFLATATTTAQSIINTVASGGGGTVKGSPVSAAYQLPTGGQVITFVGYKGTFDPAKVITSMGSFGTEDATYPDAKRGDEIACANTPATASTPSGAVCVWATASTLGITQFFDVTGPETLTTTQYKGAADTVKLRSGVETKS